MSNLEDTFGEDFAQKYKQEKRKRQERRNTVDDETIAEICDRAVNENELDAGNPQFQHTDDAGVTHDVILAQFPDMEDNTVYNYANKLDSGAVSIPFDYMSEWVSCLFNGGVEKVREFREGEHYILIGDLGTWTTDSGEEREQMSPVRGIVHVEEAKRIADNHMEEEELSQSSEQEPTPEPSSDDSDDEDMDVPFDDSEEEEESSGDDLGFLDEEEEEEDTLDVPEEEIHSQVDTLAQKSDVVWELEEGDAKFEKVVDAINNRLEDFDNEEAVSETVLSYINSQSDDDDDDEEEELMFG